MSVCPQGVGFPACISGHITRGSLHPEGSASGGLYRRGWADLPTPNTTGYGQQARGTHPTGMLSCYTIIPCEEPLRLRISSVSPLHNGDLRGIHMRHKSSAFNVDYHIISTPGGQLLKMMGKCHRFLLK